jgi:hypothetical protein
LVSFFCKHTEPKKPNQYFCWPKTPPITTQDPPKPSNLNLIEDPLWPFLVRSILEQPFTVHVAAFDVV